MAKFQKTITVEAYEFEGGLESALMIYHFTNGRTFFVPKGYDHNMRHPNEYRQGGQLLPDAVEYLVLYSADASAQRVDIGEFVLSKGDETRYEYVKRDVFMCEFVNVE